MITRIVKLHIQQDLISDFLELFEASKNRIENFQGCYEVKLLRPTNGTNVLFTISQWDSEAALNAYRQSDLFLEIWPKIKSTFESQAEAWSTAEHSDLNGS